MGKASRTKQDGDRRARIAAQREAERRAEQRKRIYLAGGSILVVVIVVIAFVLVKLNSGGGTAAAASNGPTGTALTTVTKQVTDVPDQRHRQGRGRRRQHARCSSPRPRPAPYRQRVQRSSGPTSPPSTAPPLTSSGKPEVLFIGGEYCPFCAAQRWAMVNALSRFGTFTGLTTTHSSSTDVDPNTPTWTFYKARRTRATTSPSPRSRRPPTTGSATPATATSAYATLQTPTSAEADARGRPTTRTGAIPFIDFGNKYVAGRQPLAAHPDDAGRARPGPQVGAAMNDPSSSLGKAIIGNANYMTAAICKLTNNQPATACTPTIQKLEATLAS